MRTKNLFFAVLLVAITATAAKAQDDAGGGPLNLA
jgi:hypothetical protein